MAQNFYEILGVDEKAEIEETKYKDTTDFYRYYLMWAAILFLAWMLLKSTFITNVLQD